MADNGHVREFLKRMKLAAVASFKKLYEHNFFSAARRSYRKTDGSSGLAFSISGVDVDKTSHTPSSRIL